MEPIPSLWQNVLWTTVKSLPEFYGQSWMSLALLLFAAGWAWWFSRLSGQGMTRENRLWDWVKHELKPLAVGGAVFFVGAVFLTLIQAVNSRDATLLSKIQQLEQENKQLATKAGQLAKSEGVTPIQIESTNVDLSGQSLRLIFRLSVIVPSVNVRWLHRETGLVNLRGGQMYAPPGKFGLVEPPKPPPANAVPSDNFWLEWGVGLRVGGFLNGAEYQPSETWLRGPKLFYIDIPSPNPSLTKEQIAQFQRGQAAVVAMGNWRFGDAPGDVLPFCVVVVTGPRVIDCS